MRQYKVVDPSTFAKRRAHPVVRSATQQALASAASRALERQPGGVGCGCVGALPEPTAPITAPRRPTGSSPLRFAPSFGTAVLLKGDGDKGKDSGEWKEKKWDRLIGKGKHDGEDPFEREHDYKQRRQKEERSFRTWDVDECPLFGAGELPAGGSIWVEEGPSGGLVATARRFFRFVGVDVRRGAIVHVAGVSVGDVGFGVEVWAYQPRNTLGPCRGMALSERRDWTFRDAIQGPGGPGWFFVDMVLPPAGSGPSTLVVEVLPSFMAGGTVAILTEEEHERRRDLRIGLSCSVELA